MSCDVAVTSATGSFLGVMRTPAVGNSATKTLERMIVVGDRHGMKAIPRTVIQGHPHLFDKGAEAVNVTYGFDNFQNSGVRVASHLFVVLRPGSPTALIFNFTCPEAACVDDGGKLDELMHDLKFTV